VSPERRSSLGPLRLNIESGELLHGDRVTKLTLKATQVLVALAQRTGELVSKQELFRTGGERDR
jgi:DNA-binding winged helix-turn-helix (wHTH) protein